MFIALFFVAGVILIAVSCYVHRIGNIRKNLDAFVCEDRVMGLKIRQWMVVVMIAAIAASVIFRHWV